MEPPTRAIMAKNSGAQKFNGPLDLKEPKSGVGVWRPRQFKCVARQFEVVSEAPEALAKQRSRCNYGANMSQIPNRGKNFINEEEIQCCRRFLQILQDPIVGDKQQKEAFWEWVTIH